MAADKILKDKVAKEAEIRKQATEAQKALSDAKRDATIAGIQSDLAVKVSEISKGKHAQASANSDIKDSVASNAEETSGKVDVINKKNDAQSIPTATPQKHTRGSSPIGIFLVMAIALLFVLGLRRRRLTSKSKSEAIVHSEPTSQDLDIEEFLESLRSPKKSIAIKSTKRAPIAKKAPAKKKVATKKGTAKKAAPTRKKVTKKVPAKKKAVAKKRANN